MIYLANYKRVGLDVKWEIVMQAAWPMQMIYLCYLPLRKGFRNWWICVRNMPKKMIFLFNGNKSQFLIFIGRGNSPKDCHVNVNGTRVWNVEQATHLGHSLSTNDPDSSVGGANAQFWRSFNIFRSDFGHINSTLQCRLFKQHCCKFLWFSIVVFYE